MTTFLFLSLFAKQLPLWQDSVVKKTLILKKFRTEIAKCRGRKGFELGIRVLHD